MMPFYKSILIICLSSLSPRIMHLTACHVGGNKARACSLLVSIGYCWARRRPGDHQIKPRDALFWFGKPEVMLSLIQFISFQNAFEMATFIWSLVFANDREFHNVTRSWRGSMEEIFSAHNTLQIEKGNSSRGLVEKP